MSKTELELFVEESKHSVCMISDVSEIKTNWFNYVGKTVLVDPASSGTIRRDIKLALFKLHNCSKI